MHCKPNIMVMERTRIKKKKKQEASANEWRKRNEKQGRKLKGKLSSVQALW